MNFSFFPRVLHAPPTQFYPASYRTFGDALLHFPFSLLNKPISETPEDVQHEIKRELLVDLLLQKHSKDMTFRHYEIQTLILRIAAGIKKS
jgi:hypothetical protein